MKRRTRKHDNRFIEAAVTREEMMQIKKHRERMDKLGEYVMAFLEIRLWVHKHLEMLFRVSAYCGIAYLMWYLLAQAHVFDDAGFFAKALYIATAMVTGIVQVMAVDALCIVTFHNDHHKRNHK